jgi:hypothetical protein
MGFSPAFGLGVLILMAYDYRKFIACSTDRNNML